MLAWPHNRRSRHKRARRVPFMTRSSSRTTGPTDTQSAFPPKRRYFCEKYPYSRLRSFRRSQHFSPYGKDHLHPPATSARAAGHTQSDSTVERDKPRANGVRVSGVWKRKATRNGRPGRQPEAGLPRRQRVEPSDGAVIDLGLGARFARPPWRRDGPWTGRYNPGTSENRRGAAILEIQPPFCPGLRFTLVEIRRNPREGEFSRKGDCQLRLDWRAFAKIVDC